MSRFIVLLLLALLSTTVSAKPSSHPQKTLSLPECRELVGTVDSPIRYDIRIDHDHICRMATLRVLLRDGRRAGLVPGYGGTAQFPSVVKIHYPETMDDIAATLCEPLMNVEGHDPMDGLECQNKFLLMLINHLEKSLGKPITHDE